MERLSYQAERARAINTLSAVIPTYGITLRKQERYKPTEESASILAAYCEAETLLLALLKEREGEGDT